MTKIQISKTPLKKFSIPYELFPTEKGEASNQILILYDNCLYTKYKLDIQYNINSEDGIEEAAIKANAAQYIGKYDIIGITLSDDELMQYDSDNDIDVSYHRPNITLNTTTTSITMWLSDYEEAVKMFNYLAEWRYA